MVKHLPTMRETRVQSLVWEDLLEKEMATHSNILAWKIPGTIHTVHGVAKSWTRLSNFTFTAFEILYFFFSFLKLNYSFPKVLWDIIPRSISFVANLDVFLLYSPKDFLSVYLCLEILLPLFVSE